MIRPKLLLHWRTEAAAHQLSLYAFSCLLFMHESWKVLFETEMNRLLGSKSIQSSVHFQVLLQIYSLNVRGKIPELLHLSMQFVKVDYHIIFCENFIALIFPLEY